MNVFIVLTSDGDRIEIQAVTDSLVKAMPHVPKDQVREYPIEQWEVGGKRIETYKATGETLSSLIEKS